MTHSFDFLVFGDSSVVDEGVVVEEEPASDVESNEDINAVVLMGGEDEEDAEAVEQPGKRVQEVDPTTCVLRDEEVQQGQGHCVSREHVVAASPGTQVEVSDRPEKKILLTT